MSRRHLPMVVCLAGGVAVAIGTALHESLGQLHLVRSYELAEDLTFFLLSLLMVGGVAWFWSRDSARSAAALRESEARHRLLVGSMDDLVFTLDGEQRFSGVFGRWAIGEKNEMLGRTPADVFGPAFAMRHEAAFERVMRGGTAEYEWSATIGGATRYFRTVLSPLRDDAAAAPGAVGVTRDVTEKTILSDAYHETTDLLHAIVAGSPAAILTLDEQGRIRSANAAAESILGKGQGRLLGELLVRPAESEEVAAMLRRCSSEETSFAGVEVTRWRDDGARSILSLSAAPIHGHRDGPSPVVAVALDVTERHRADEMLQRYRLMTQHLRDAVLFVGANGRIADANDVAVAAYGWNRAELVGLPLSAITGTAFSIGQVSGFAGETEHFRRDGSRFPVEVSCVGGNVGGEEHLFMLARDITSRRRREALERLLHEVDRMILQEQPLRTIAGFTCRRLAEQYEGAVVELHIDGEALTTTGDASGLIPSLTIPLTADERPLGMLKLFTASPSDIDPEVVNLLLAFGDQVALSIASARDHQELALQRVALESVPNAVVVTDRDGTIRWVNPACVQLTGFSVAESVGKKPSLFKSGNHSSAFYRLMWETLSGGHTWSGELWNRRKDGSLYLEEQTITPVRGRDGEITCFVAIKQDVTVRRRQEEQIRHLAMHDALTDLPNRRSLDAAMQRLAREARGGSAGALMILDIDNFKPVNDTLGHVGGDQLLAELARLLRDTLRPLDFLARLGGDEFAVLLQATTMEAAVQVASRLRDAVSSRPFRCGDRLFDLTVSIGIAPIDGELDVPGAMVHADSAMYAAKESGRNKIVSYPFTGEAGLRLVDAGRWASRITNALRDDRFVLHYQPVVRLGNGEAEHFEALIRMLDDDGGTIPPRHFLSAAERFGLMPRIDRWVVANVLRVLAASPDEVRIFVNISGASLGDAQLLAEIERLVSEARVPPGRLAFEITESAAIRDLTVAQTWIHRLKDHGCLFAIDDFGVGFSSFSYLRALSADYVKIDRSFVMDVDTNPTNRALVQAVMTVAQTLGKEVIAEGVETLAHADVLRELGVELGQGFHWGQPRLDPFMVLVD